MKTIKILLAWLMLGLIWVLHWLPLPVLAVLGEGIGMLAYATMRARRRITLTNLRLCFPEKSRAERHAIARQHFRYYGRSIMERGILWWGSEKRLRRLIHLETPIPLEDIKAGPCILLCSHFLCLEVINLGIVLNSDLKLCNVYAPQSNPVLEKVVIDGRLRFREGRPIKRNEGIKPIIRSMRDGYPFMLFPDMDFGMRDSAFVDFFGVPTATLTSSARLAGMTEANVIPVIARFLPHYKGWSVRFYPKWDNYPGNDNLAATRQINAYLEDRIRETPAEYYWVHKRFKTRPEGEPSFYAHFQDN